MAGKLTFTHLQYQFRRASLTDNLSTPAIHDPNTGITLWESGAIIEYLIAEYDKSNKLSFASGPEKYYALQYLHFQMSGQGPYFGQFAWFKMFHQEKLPSAVERYGNEIKRVTGVLDGLLKGKDYLVGDKVSFADLSFITWYWLVPFLDVDNGLKLEETYPNWAKWNKALNARPAVKKTYEARAKIMSGGGGH